MSSAGRAVEIGRAAAAATVAANVQAMAEDQRAGDAGQPGKDQAQIRAGYVQLHVDIESASGTTGD